MSIVRPFGPHCYVVRGTLSTGSFWLKRICVSERDGDCDTIEDAAKLAEATAERMNGMGASVEWLRQSIHEDGWHWVDG